MTSQQSLKRYVKAFQSLNTDKSSSRWDKTTHYRAPHKPLLLLAILDLFAEGSIGRNLIKLSPELGELFDIYWSQVRPRGRERGFIVMPYFHLQSDGFWHLIPKPGQQEFLNRVQRIRSIEFVSRNSNGSPAG